MIQVFVNIGRGHVWLCWTWESSALNWLAGQTVQYNTKFVKRHVAVASEALNRKQFAKVNVAGTLSEWFRVKKRVRQARKLAYYGHTTRNQGSRPEKEIMQGTMPGAWRRGRPRAAWMDNIKTWTGLSVEESVRMTDDRDKWRKYVRGCMDSHGLYLPTVILTIIWYSITHSLFHSWLKTFLFCKSLSPQPFLFLLWDTLHGFSRLFTVISGHICFLLLVFLFLHFVVVGSVR